MNIPEAEIRSARPWNRGAALFFSLLVAVMMLIVVMPFLFSLSTRFRVTEKSFKSMAAANLAEAGIERAIWELNYGNISLWSGNFQTRTLSLPNVQAAGGRIAGDIDIEVQNPASDNPLILASGTVPWSEATSFEKRVRVRMRHGFRSFFDFGIFTKDGLELQGNAYTDSFNSDDAPYDPAAIGTSGDIGTNAGNRWDLVLLNNTIIHGDCMTGYGSDPSEVVHLRNAAAVTGTIGALDDVKPLPSISPPLLAPKGAFSVATGVTSATITESGQYSSFTLDSNSKVTISGDVQLFINGNFTMDSNSILEIAPGSTVEIYLGNGIFTQASNSQVNNLTMSAKNLVFLGTSDFHQMYWRANSDFYGAVYVPDARIDYSANADLFGSLVSQYLYLSSNAGLHYDEALAKWEKYSVVLDSYIVLDWQEY
jgi:hypothetical protein